jgi:hypothetical protein
LISPPETVALGAVSAAMLPEASKQTHETAVQSFRMNLSMTYSPLSIGASLTFRCEPV